MRPPRVTEGIAAARASLRQALDTWDATDLSKIQQCQEYIARAADHLRPLADSGTASADAAAGHEVAALRADAHRLMRLVDACSAFHHGLRLSLGNPGKQYTVSGEVVPESAAVASGGLEA